MKLKYTLIVLFLLTQSILILAAPIANFNVVTSCGSGSVQFNDVSTNGAINASWNFGNGITLTTISGSNPLVVYSKPGMVTVTLTSTDGGGISNSKILNVFVPATPNFSYGAASICLGTELTNGFTYRDPSPDFSALNGNYTLVLPGLESYFDPSTGRITYDIGITSATYQFKYSYTAPGCALPLEYTTTLGIGNASIGPFSGPVVQQLGVCNRILLIKSTIARGALQWQISNSTTGNVFVNLPSGPTINPGLGSFTNPNNISSQDNFFTPTITITSIIRLKLSDPYCGVLDNSINDQLYTVAGLTKAGTASTATPVTCQNYSPIISLTGYLGQVTWQYSTDGVIYNNSSGTNAFVPQTIPGVVGSTFNTVHSPSPSIFNTTGNFFFRALVNYTQYGVLGSCEDIYSNVVTITSQFCTVTSAIVNTTTSPICLSQATVPGVLFGSLSTITGTVASITGWRWNFGSGATPVTIFTTTPTFPLVKYSNASTPIKNISLTLTGTGFTYITSTTIQVDDFSNQTGIGPPISNLTICSGSFATLSVNSSNLNPVIQWQSSPDGILTNYFNVTTTGNGETARQYTTPGLSNTIFYRATVKNGVCPMVTTSGRSLTVIQPLTINPNLDQPTLTICQGNNAVLTASGSNGNIDFLTSPTFGGIYNTVSGTYLSAGVFQTDFFVLTGSYFFKARISNVFNGCSQSLSGIYTVSVVSCPILANFTSSGAVFTNKACINNSNFIFTDITPTIAGVKFVKWDWDFGSNATLGFLSTTVGNATKTNYAAEGIQIVNLTITAVAGATTYTGSNFLTLTVDGLSDASSITALDNPICIGTNTGLSFTSANTNPSIYWQQSVTGWNTVANATTTSYLTLPLLSTTGFRAVVTNGVCSSVTSSIVVVALPSPVVNLLSASVLTVCSGGQRRLSISGSNFSSINWLEATVPGFSNFDTVTVGTGNHALVYTTDYLYTGNYYFTAELNSLTCSPQYSQVITVTSFDCPISPVISVTSAYFAQRTCNDKPSFTFKDITPTISGVRFVRWDWDFDSESDISALSTTTGAPIIKVNYSIATPNFINSIKIVRLTITGVTGSNTFTGIPAIVVLTIDGIPSVTNFRTQNTQICAGNSNLILYDNFSPLGAALNWYVSTTNGANYDFLSVVGSNYQQPTTIPSIYQFFITADNGVCPTYNSTTTSIVSNTVTSQPVIYAFSYPLQAYCNSSGSIAPNLLTNGTFAGSSFSNNPLGLSISSNGTVNPSGSIPNEDLSNSNYVVTYSIPSIGGCLPTSTTTTLTIGKNPTIPTFQYNLNPVCNKSGNSIDPIPDASFMPAGGTYSSTFTGFPVSPSSGHINLTNVNEGVYEILFTTVAKDGCAAKSKNYTVSVSGLPSTPDFDYDTTFNCNNRGSIPLKAGYSNIDFSNPSEGYWSLNRTTTGMSIDPTNGSIILTTVSSGGLYNITYRKYTSGGCSSEIVYNTKPAFVYVFELASTPFVDYGSPFCTNTTNIVPLPNSTFSGGSFNSISSIIKFNDITTGDLQVKDQNLTFTGVVEVNYTKLSNNGYCPNVSSSTLITFTGIPAPVIQYSNNFVCNDPSTLIYPSGGVYTLSGFYRARNLLSNPLAIDAQTGVITVTSTTVQDLYTIDYVATISGCAITSVTSTGVTINIQDKADPPFFDYGNNPICQKTFVLTNKSGFSYQQFSALPSSLVVDSDGNLYTYSTPDGIYTVTGSNNSAPVFIGSIPQTVCPSSSNIAVVTIGSQITIPDFSYGTGFFCNDGGSVSPSPTLSGGSFSSTNAGLIILDSVTGVIDLKNSTHNIQYVVTYSINATNACVITPKKDSVYIDQLPSAYSFSYPQTQYCQGGGIVGNPLPFSSSIRPLGYYSISPQSSAINTFSGFIDLAAISAGAKQIVYISQGKNACPDIPSDPFNITINQKAQAPQVFYGTTPHCVRTDTISIITPSSSFGLSANATFSGPDFIGSSSATLDSTTGSIRLSNLPINQYKIYSINIKNPDAGNCIGLSGEATVTISSRINSPTFDYSESVFCKSGDTRPSNSGLLSDGYFYASPSDIVFKDVSTGLIDLSKSIQGKYKVYYQVPSVNGCPSFSTPADSFSIISPTIGVISSESSKGFICGGNGVQLEISSFDGTLTWQKRNYNDSTWNNLSVTPQNNGYFSQALYDSTYIRAKSKFDQCPDTTSNTIKVKVIQGSKGGTASSNENTNYKEICNALTTDLTLREYVGKIIWQFSKDSLVYDDLVPKDTTAKLTTPSQNEYGLKIWYRAAVTNETCPADYSSYVLVKVCDKDNFIPNVLSPTSGDASHSTWDISSLKLRDFAEVRIFNRYGSQVYFASGSEASSHAWDGGGLPAGTYYYVIDRKDQSTPLTGSISIVK